MRRASSSPSNVKMPQVKLYNRMLDFINRNFFINKNYTTEYQLSQTSSGIRRAILVASPNKTRSCPVKGYEEEYLFAFKSYNERLERGKFIECFKILKEFMNVSSSKLFSNDSSPRTMSNGVKL